MEHRIQQVTPAKPKHLDKLVHHHVQQPLEEVKYKATGPRSIFGKELTLRIAATEDKDDGAGNMRADQRL